MPPRHEIVPELVPGLLPAEEVSLLAGASGAGKTTLIMQLVKALQDGTPFFGHALRPNLRLGYIAADRSWQAYERLARQIGVNLDTLAIRALVDDDAVDLDRFEADPLRTLTSLIGPMLPLDLLVVDPLIIFLGVDTNKYHLNAARLMRVNKLCRRNHFTILGTHHATKARSDYSFKRPQDRISGTSALLGFTSTQLFLADPNETGEPFHQWHIISHHAPAKVLALRRDDRGLFELVTDDPPSEEAPTDTVVWRHDITATILSTLDFTTPRSKSDLRVLLPAGTSERSFERVLTQLVADGAVLRVAHGMYVLADPSATASPVVSADPAGWGRSPTPPPSN